MKPSSGLPGANRVVQSQSCPVTTSPVNVPNVRSQRRRDFYRKIPVLLPPQFARLTPLTKGLVWELARLGGRDGVLYLGEGRGIEPLHNTLAFVLGFPRGERRQLPRMLAELLACEAMVLDGDHLVLPDVSALNTPTESEPPVVAPKVGKIPARKNGTSPVAQTAPRSAHQAETKPEPSSRNHSVESPIVIDRETNTLEEEKRTASPPPAVSSSVPDFVSKPSDPSPAPILENQEASAVVVPVVLESNAIPPETTCEPLSPAPAAVSLTIDPDRARDLLRTHSHGQISVAMTGLAAAWRYTCEQLARDGFTERDFESLGRCVGAGKHRPWWDGAMNLGMLLGKFDAEGHPIARGLVKALERARAWDASNAPVPRSRVLLAPPKSVRPPAAAMEEHERQRYLDSVRQMREQVGRRADAA